MPESSPAPRLLSDTELTAKLGQIASDASISACECGGSMLESADVDWMVAYITALSSRLALYVEFYGDNSNEALQEVLSGRRARQDDPYEYRTTEGQRKAWDGEPDLSKEGWEEYQPWERFDFTEERYWRRLKTPVGYPEGGG